MAKSQKRSGREPKKPKKAKITAQPMSIFKEPDQKKPMSSTRPIKP